MNIYLFIAAVLIISFTFGKVLEKIRVPWIFSSLLLGALLAIYNPFEKVTSSEPFEIFARIGMYLLLFLVGFELDVRKLRKKGGFIFGSAFFIIFLEGLIGSLIVHYVFGYAWIVSLLVSLSFATVGEAILIPILHEFNLVNTSLGQLIIGIGTADDFIELLLLFFAVFFVGTQNQSNIVSIIIYLVILALLTIGFRVFGRERDRFKFASIETLFLFILFVFFLFIGVGAHADAAPLAAILAGTSVRLFIRDERLVFVDNEIKSMAYGLFAPLFFVWIGMELNVGYIISAPLLILLVVLVSNGVKILGSYIVARKELGKKGSILLGIGLSVRFSTSIIIMKFLFDHGVVGYDIFSIVIASSIIFQFVIPLLFSRLASKWGFSREQMRLVE